MKMHKTVFAMGAALAAVIGASPASATVFQYTLVNDDVVRIDNVAGTATFTGGNIDASMTNDAFKSFSGGDASIVNFSILLSSITAKYYNSPMSGMTLKPVEDYHFDSNKYFSLSGGRAVITALWGTGVNDDGFMPGEYASRIKSYAVNPDSTNPSPDPMPLVSPPPITGPTR